MFIIVISCPECAGIKPVILKAFELFNTRVCIPVTPTKELFKDVAVITTGAGGFANESAESTSMFAVPSRYKFFHCLLDTPM